MRRIPSIRASFEADCRRLGWKCTIQRFAVYQAVCGNTEHPTVDMVCQSVREIVPGISADSVHRILDNFAQAGLIQRMEGLSCLHYDSEVKEHAHFVCTQCGRIEDLPTSIRSAVLPQIRSLGHVSDIRLIGLCRHCAQRNKSPSRTRRSA